MTPDDKNTEALEAIFHEAALADVDEASTPDQKRRAREIMKRNDLRVAELRAMQLAAAPPKPPRPIRPAFLAMTRDALLAAIGALTTSGDVQVAYRNHSTLSDDDLRRLLESLTPDAE